MTDALPSVCASHYWKFWERNTDIPVRSSSYPIRNLRMIHNGITDKNVRVTTTYTVRHVHLDDVPKMSAFFREAYGEQSVFISERFLKFYFGSLYMPVDLAISLLAASNETGKVVAFYGCRAYKLQLFGQIVSMSQNVNAYTLCYTGFRCKYHPNYT